MTNIPEYTVTEFSRTIKRVVQDAFGYVRIKGEITGFKKASSGHLYFSLKDQDNVLTAVCFRNMAQLVSFEMADGLQVTASGQITTFEGRSNYQIIVEKLEISGIGAILEMIEKRRQKLLAEGLFDEIHKKPIPFFPKIIGVITSPTGAVIEDIKHRITARCGTHLLLYPSPVQGEKAAAEVIRGIRFFNQLKVEKRPEVIIIARGGGSFEDLLPFQDENLVREVFKSDIPIISAIGHETDVTLIDYVADLRAPTPTAAAELATPVLGDLKNQLNFLTLKLKSFTEKSFSERNQHLKNLQRYLLDPATIVFKAQERFKQMAGKVAILTKNNFDNSVKKLASLSLSKQLLQHKLLAENQKIIFCEKQLLSRIKPDLEKKQNLLFHLNKSLQSNHYSEILKRGFALIKRSDGQMIFSVESLKSEEEFIIEMQDGEAKINTSSQLSLFAKQS